MPKKAAKKKAAKKKPAKRRPARDPVVPPPEGMTRYCVVLDAFLHALDAGDASEMFGEWYGLTDHGLQRTISAETRKRARPWIFRDADGTVVAEVDGQRVGSLPPADRHPDNVDVDTRPREMIAENNRYNREAARVRKARYASARATGDPLPLRSYRMYAKAYAETPTAEEAIARFERFFGLQHLHLPGIRAEEVVTFQMGEYPLQVEDDGSVYLIDLFNRRHDETPPASLGK